MKPNILIDSLPETVEVDGREYSINSDFRISILFELLIAEKEIDPNDKIIQAFKLYFGDCIPDDYDLAADAIMYFYKCGATQKNSSNTQKRAVRQEPIYSYEYDDAYIYAAFLDQYGIDLNDIDYLHWWKFNAMFRGLKSDNEIVKIMGYRSADLSKITLKSEKNRMANLKAIYALPSNLTKEEKVAAAGAIFGSGLL